MVVQRKGPTILARGRNRAAGQPGEAKTAMRAIGGAVYTKPGAIRIEGCRVGAVS
jgi:hypothetical protein